jgi:SEC-C motif
MTTKKFDPALRRRMYWANNLKTATACPECGALLQREPHAYAIAALENGQTTAFASSNNGGHFCGACPVVVLENDVFNEITKESPSITRYQVMGIIDPDNTTDGDIAISEFLTDKYTVKHTDKIGRNDVCPCKSGKKYKKCCMPR